MSSLARPLDRADLPKVARSGVGFGLFLLFVLMLLPVWKQPDDLIRSVAKLDGVTAGLSIGEVQKGRFVETGPSVPIGFGSTTHWLRVDLQPQADGEDILLRLRPIALDRATLFIREANGLWRTEVTGDMVDPESRSWPNLLRHVLRVQGVTKPTTVYVKVESQSPATIFLSAFPAHIALQLDVRTLAFHAFVLGLKIVSMLLILLTLPRQKSRVNAIFFTLEFTYLVYLGLHLGYGHALFHNLPPALLDTTMSVIVGVVVLVGAMFHRAFLGQFDPAPIARLAASLPILLGALSTAALLTGIRLPGLALAAGAYVAMFPVIVAMLFTLRGDAPPGRGMVRLIYAAYLPVLMLNFLTTLGIVRLDWFYRNGPELISLANSTLILALLVTMNRAVDAEWHEQRGRIRQAILAQRAETKVRQAQHFLTRLVADETRGALDRLQAILRGGGNSEGPAALGRAMAALDGVIEDCLHADVAETGVWRTSTEPFDVAKLLREVVGCSLRDKVVVDLAAPEWVPLVSDSSLTGIILRHIVHNAAAYSEPGTQVVARLSRVRRDGTDGIALSLGNTVPAGVTIDAERIFEKFFRGTQASSTSGTGLGLFICREIASTLGGTIHAEVAARHVTFHLWLPDRPW